jgi:uncharacterized protein YcbK (DUF882 family)
MTDSWPWKKFRRWEFECRCRKCGFDTVDAELMSVLCDLKNNFRGARVFINSGCRCVEYNEAVQKSINPDYIPYSSKSQHMLGRAVDVSVEGHTPSEVYAYLSSKYLNKFGIGKYLVFVHIDTRSKGVWRQD